MRTGPSRIRQAYAVGCALLLGTALLIAGSAYVFATQPIASEAQVQAARAHVERAQSELPTSCPRPVLRGVALPGDGGEGLRALTSQSFAACIELIERQPRAARDVTLVPVVLGRFQFEVPNPTARLATAEPSSFEQSAAVACAGLDGAVQALLQRGSGCTASPFFLAPADTPDFARTKLAMFILARARIHEGRLQEGMELLLDVIRLGQDLSRGAASLATGHRALELQSEATQQLSALLASDLPWTAAILDELARQVQVLVGSMPEPTAWFAYGTLQLRSEAVEVLQVLGIDGHTENVQSDLAAEDYGATRWPACTSTLQACSDRYRVEAADVSAQVAARYRWTWIPGVARQTGIEMTYVERLREREHVLTDAARTEALLRALPALFLHRRMSLSGTCPSTESLQVEARAAGVAEGFEIASSNQSILFWPPGVSTVSETELLYRAYCPALREP